MMNIPDQVYLWLNAPGIEVKGGWDTDPNRKNIPFVKAGYVADLAAENATLRAERDEGLRLLDNARQIERNVQSAREHEHKRAEAALAELATLREQNEHLLNTTKIHISDDVARAALHEAMQTVATLRASEAAAVARVGIPPDVFDLVRRIGRAEWGATDPKSAEDHAVDTVKSFKATCDHFEQEGEQPLHGLYIEGTGIIICHTGTSPNSPQIAKTLTGLWNQIFDAALAEGRPT